jgi:hypothetical protein
MYLLTFNSKKKAKLKGTFYHKYFFSTFSPYIWVKFTPIQNGKLDKGF